MRALIVCFSLVVLFAGPVDADDRRGHGKARTTEPPPQSPPVASALQVLDTNNAIVGQYTYNGCLVRFFDGHLVDICDLQVDGTVVWEVRPQLLFLEPDCQGTPYLAAFRNALSRWSSINDGMIHFPGDPIMPITVRSFLDSADGESYTCEGAPLYGEDWSIPEVAGPLQSVPLSAIGTPPFRVR
jgi:hypothetical protein